MKIDVFLFVGSRYVHVSETGYWNKILNWHVAQYFSKGFARNSFQFTQTIVTLTCSQWINVNNQLFFYISTNFMRSMYVYDYHATGVIQFLLKNLEELEQLRQWYKSLLVANFTYIFIRITILTSDWYLEWSFRLTEFVFLMNKFVEIVDTFSLTVYRSW